ncbi:hypothetical protein EON81_26505 [bacterium]|nr:MAG: hypothetical protein EON81_26505 [bacterium]
MWRQYRGNKQQALDNYSNALSLGYTKTLKELSALPRMIPFVTSFRDDLPEKPHNMAAIFTRGEESPRYAKRRLFGGESRMHTAGDKAVSVEGRGLNICFDSCFPSIIRDTVRQGADVVLLPTIDPPSTNHFLAAVHASYTPFRSAESGVPFVRADGYAFSMMTDARGKIVAETGDGEKVLVADVPRATRSTIYRATGDWFIPFSAILVIVGIVQARRKSGVAEEGVEALTGEERSL